MLGRTCWRGDRGCFRGRGEASGPEEGACYVRRNEIAEVRPALALDRVVVVLPDQPRGRVRCPEYAALGMRESVTFVL